MPGGWKSKKRWSDRRELVRNTTREETKKVKTIGFNLSGIWLRLVLWILSRRK